MGVFHLRALAVVVLKRPALHSRVCKAPPLQPLDSFKVTALFLCGFPFLTLCPLAVTFCRVAVTPQPCGGFFGEIALFGLVALPAV
ncbi:hypothetical protein SDC9_105283 [bioreactor metagenome]|uniref:Uncharacterized protein n=1 Tax=bioreactor metagenome TaxID=1076179 RepID=A0A645AZ42_9ZZZZ